MSQHKSKEVEVIEDYVFGKITIQGQFYKKDLKILKGRIVTGWWRRQGHWVSVDDVEDILLANPAVLVVGTGASGLMQVDPKLGSLLRGKNIDLIEQLTNQAVGTFNRLKKEGVDVAAAFHLTC